MTIINRYRDEKERKLYLRTCFTSIFLYILSHLVIIYVKKISLKHDALLQERKHRWLANFNRPGGPSILRFFSSTMLNATWNKLASAVSRTYNCVRHGDVRERKRKREGKRLRVFAVHKIAIPYGVFSGHVFRDLARVGKTHPPFPRQSWISCPETR